MTITTQQENQILRIGQAMFNAAPGASYLSEFSAYLDFGSSLADLAQSLSGTEAFLGRTYYDCMSSTEFANAFVNDLVGNNASAPDKAWATNYIIDRMAAGITQAGIVSELTQTLSAVRWDDANWGVAATQYNTRIATKIIDNLTGNAASASAKADAVDYIVWEMAANGKNAGQMVEWAITALDEMDHADSLWGDAAILFDNRIEVSRYYSVDKAGTAIDIGTLQQVLAPVTTSAGSIATAISQFDSLLSGVARDGYLADATLFIDLNGDRVRTLDESQVTTDANGNFTFPAGAFGQIVATGGTDITTLLPFNGAFTAPAGSTVVSPLTTLLQVFIEQGQTLAEAKLTVVKALGVSAGSFDPTHFDPLVSALDVNATTEQRALATELRGDAAKIANLMVAAGSLLQGAAGGADKLDLISAEQAVMKALANAINEDSDGVISFSDQAMLRSVLIDSATLLCHNTDVTAALGKITDMATDFATLMATAADNIDNAVAAGGDIAAILVNIAQAEVVVQGELADQLFAAAETGDLSGLLPGFTDDAFQDKTEQVIIGDLDPNSTADDAAVAESNAAVTAIDITAPVMRSATVSADGKSVVIIYSEPLTGTAEAGDYGLTLSSGNTTITGATIGTGTSINKVTLTLSNAIGSSATVSNLVYNAAAGTIDSIKDTAIAPNSAATQTLVKVTNGSTVSVTPIDTTAPVMTSAVVSADGTQLVITYSEPLTGTAEADDYGVTLSSGNLTSATSATIGTGVNANKVTLNLSLAILSTTTVSDLTYTATDGTANSIKDAATVPNNAPTQTLAMVVNGSTLTVVPVDTIAPAMISAAVSADGTKLVITYSEPLTGTAEAGDYALTLSLGTVTATAATIGTGAAANKVTLTLSSPINSTTTVSNLAYTATAGTANSIKDTATTPNNAATQTLATVINGSTVTVAPIDTTAPVMTSAVVSADGTKLVITYSEPLTGTAEAGDYGVTLSSGNLTSATAATIGTGVNANKVTLDLSLAIRSTTTVSNLTYTATDGIDNSIKDAATVPNNAPTQTLTTVINGSTLTVAPADTTAPAMISAAVSVDGTKLVITYSEPLTGTAEAGDYAIALSSGAVTATAATIGTGAVANKVTLTLSGTINSGITVSNLAYTATAGTANSIKDTATVPNNAATQTLATVTNGSTVTTIDTTAPVISSAAVSTDGKSLVITYSEPLTGTAEAGDYGVTLSSGTTTATAAAIGIGANANKVTLTLSNTINSGVIVSNLAYNATAGTANSIKDAATPANNAATQTLATVTNGSTVTSGGATPITLTTSDDTVNGTEGNDTFNATYDGGLATDTLGAGDKINGLGGSDTLNIDHFGNFAMTPPDSLWTGLSNIEKVVLNTTGDGAQTITTGTFFQAAFGTNGVDFKTTTSGAGAITMDLSTFTGRAVLTTTSIAGAQVIVTGSGVTSVTAASDAGALDIKGVGLATVIATTTGAGAQTIGDAGGNGANLTSVNATAVSGTQTITSTSTANATVIATSSSGKQLITTGDGNDTITATAAAGTTNTITANAGNDTIVAGLGNDLITGGLGADQMTGGGGVDTFAIGGNGSIIGISMDIITDFNFGGSDILTFGGATTVLAIDATLLVAGSNVQTTGGGVIVFHADDNTLALKIAAIQADTQLDAAGSIGMFVDGGNTYVYYAGAAAANADDQLIQLSGVTTLATITGGATTSIG
jgi:hypothetical protein